ncbi:hypothetical protein [Engelhardtia mirabilis]|uniref:Uncharacterized protein n=1 Tax=Engelhardtia mirabilis TaxID=2528011 RepID=A0A518BL26_9BACT|nr:hypothetical protein Pla133_27630 [Planctomycetes bacterium Pla133]QDV02001.1 hypothetical protein Pla86_27620 [Planctomycetes bacterium Pla86]
MKWLDRALCILAACACLGVGYRFGHHAGIREAEATYIERLREAPKLRQSLPDLAPNESGLPLYSGAWRLPEGSKVR